MKRLIAELLFLLTLLSIIFFSITNHDNNQALYIGFFGLFFSVFIGSL